MFPEARLTFILAGVLAAVAVDALLLWRWRKWRVEHPQATSQGLLSLGSFIQEGGLSLAPFHLASRPRAWLEAVIPRDDRARLRTILVAACLLLNLSIGLAYASDIMIRGWQIWTWLVASSLAVIALMPASGIRLRWGREGWILLGLTSAGAALRWLALSGTLAGVHGDEGRTFEFTLIHVFPEPGLTISPFRAGLYAQPTLFNYLIWASLRLVGENAVGLRLPSALAATLAIPATYFVVSQFAGKRVGLLSAALVTTYHFHMHWSHLGLNNVWDTLWVPLILGFFAWGWSHRWSGGAVLSGVALGLSQYFYAGAKVALLLLPLLAFLLWRQDRDRSLWAGYFDRCLAAAAVVAAPHLAFALMEPSLFTERARDALFWGPAFAERLVAVDSTFFGVIWDQAFHAFAGFTSFTDMTGFYRPGVPLVMGLAAPLFLAGTILAVMRRQWIPVAWVGLTALLGGFMFVATPSSPHYVVAIPAIAWLLALVLDAVWTDVRPSLAITMLVIIMGTDLAYYFAVYLPSGPIPDLNLPFPSRPFR